jgi:hypothetical protein
LLIRNGYSELFYPPVTGFVLTSVGVIILLFYIIDLNNSLSIYTPFSILGRWSLQIYVIHLVLIALLGKILGQLKIPGFSDYLHPYDENHIIGFGKDTVEKNGRAYYLGMKVAIFDVTDVANPKEMFTERIGDRGTDSELLRNHHHHTPLHQLNRRLHDQVPPT